MWIKRFIIICYSFVSIFKSNLFLEEPAAPAAVATKNFFMDIYAKEVSKMQSASKSSAPAKKRNFDATQFNTYGRPLGKIIFILISHQKYHFDSFYIILLW